MTHAEALRVIELCRGWNSEQKSVSLVFRGIRTNEDEIYDARRAALRAAWKRLAAEPSE